MEEPDALLLRQYRRGNVDALEKLVHRYRRQLYGFIVGMCGGPGDADEVFQEVWFRAIRKIGSYREDCFVAWLIRIARNIIIDRWRRRKGEVAFEDTAEDGAGLDERLPADGPDPAARVMQGDTARRIMAAIDELPREQREVVLMRVQADMSFKEIAAAQGVSINTSLARMQYGLSKLRTILGDEYRACTGRQ